MTLRSNDWMPLRRALREVADAVQFSDHINEAQLTDVQVARKLLATYESYLKRKLAVRLPPLYRCPKTGATWSGRGRQPVWLQEALAAGVPLSYFLIAPESKTESELDSGAHQESASGAVVESELEPALG